MTRNGYSDDYHTPAGPRPQEEGTIMGIGVSVFLIAVGAILTFALDATVSGIDLDLVGVILMIAGALGVVLDLIIFAPRRRGVADTGYTTTRTVVDR